MNEEMFYGTLPQDTQDFRQVLAGVGRSLREIGRSTQYLPYDVLGAPVDLATMAMRPFGYQTQQPVGGSDWLIQLARQYGLADQPTGSGIETATRLAVGVPSPVAVPRAIGAFAQGLNRASDITTEQANRAADALVRQITGNPQATAPGVIQETAMPFMQAVAPKMPGLLEMPAKSELGFYSALEQATMPLQNKGTGQQFLAQIEKTAGVKPEEIKWTGLDDFLKSRQNVTKQEVQDYLAANRVDLQEVRLGDPSPEDVRLFMEDEAGQGYDYVDALDYLRSTEPSPKFSQYTLPGGENYREILLTLPPKPLKFDVWLESMGKKYGGDTPRSQWSAEDNADFERLLKADKTEERPYRSSHFDQPNILAHMRVNDRVVDGKNTLFIEEIQSDWHQAGRKRGYRQGEEVKPMTYKAEDFQVSQTESQWVTTDARGQQRVVGKGTVGSEQEAKEYFARWLTGLEKEQAGRATVERSNQVPDAPFKTTWHELALKRAIQEASEKGYDRIAFTTGKTQAERYDLSKQVDSLLYTKNPDGTYRVSAQVQGQGRMLGESIPENDLADYVGKEVAEKMAKGTGNRTQVAGAYDPVSMTSPMSYMTELSGVDLKVGGEGMKGFYDQILPKSLEKLGKKFDAKVGKTEMDGVEVWAMDITPKMRESVLTKGQPLFAATPAIPAMGLLGDEGE